MSEEIAIVYDVPLPTQPPKRRPGGVRYPFGKMKVGGSFFLPLERARNVSTAAAQYQRHHPGNRRFITRLVVDEQHGLGVRCWRES